MATPQFSVIITCHNQRKFIADAIQSAISQIYESREVIVVDDASSDGSDSVLKSYGEMIRLVSLERNQGASEARNPGTAAARGNYLVYLDGDDLLTVQRGSVRLRSAIKAKRELPIVEKLDKDTIAGGLELLESKERVNK